ncbi:hypothetical protein CONPUDRAFT_146138 [Coniophora puteana RWD-64-598 SS2]|uniref:Uncharacterized protein n=1 Tax=Coniophora puteana (strain RWD-64-598) TaxID=741705 RepID=A0A5M3MD58_CONPW|nr:uncharacterized protein CONPUDRAFT_146138 [Coniophora puteana RWD-64-598 SS2]EIW77023.1 hypothetical protein CONPUDRAFT_146138 [Coniophora puteana RWD-64-598 SS2]
MGDECGYDAARSSALTLRIWTAGQMECGARQLDRRTDGWTAGMLDRRKMWIPRYPRFCAAGARRVLEAESQTSTFDSSGLAAQTLSTVWWRILALGQYKIAGSLDIERERKALHMCYVGVQGPLEEYHPHFSEADILFLLRLLYRVIAVAVLSTVLDALFGLFSAPSKVVGDGTLSQHLLDIALPIDSDPLEMCPTIVPICDRGLSGDECEAQRGSEIKSAVTVFVDEVSLHDAFVTSLDTERLEDIIPNLAASDDEALARVLSTCCSATTSASSITSPPSPFSITQPTLSIPETRNQKLNRKRKEQRSEKAAALRAQLSPDCLLPGTQLPAKFYGTSRNAVQKRKKKEKKLDAMLASFDKMVHLGTPSVSALSLAGCNVPHPLEHRVVDAQDRLLISLDVGDFTAGSASALTEKWARGRLETEASSNHVTQCIRIEAPVEDASELIPATNLILADNAISEPSRSSMDTRTKAQKRAATKKRKRDAAAAVEPTLTPLTVGDRRYP